MNKEFVNKLYATNLKLGLGEKMLVLLDLNVTMTNTLRTNGGISLVLTTRNVMSENLGLLTTSVRPLVKLDLLKILKLPLVVVKILISTTDLK